MRDTYLNHLDYCKTADQREMIATAAENTQYHIANGLLQKPEMVKDSTLSPRLSVSVDEVRGFV